MSTPNENRRRVGVFGGSFDPIHNGHIRVAEAALTQHQLDCVLFVPVRQQPHKAGSPEASGEHRLAMVKLAIEGNQAFSASDCELRRQGKSFTIDTIRELRRQLSPGAELFFILGADSVPELPMWKDLDELRGLCTFVVAARPGWPPDALDVLSRHLPAERVAAMRDAAVRTTDVRVSSTDIRERVAGGASIEGLVPRPVVLYITENKLYRTS